MKKQLFLSLVSALVMFTATAKAENWQCKTANGQFKMKVQVAADGKTKAQIGEIFSFGTIEVKGNQDSLKGELAGHDMWEASVDLERSRERLEVGQAHVKVYIFIDCLGEDTYDLQMNCQISQ